MLKNVKSDFIKLLLLIVITQKSSCKIIQLQLNKWVYYYAVIRISLEV